MKQQWPHIDYETHDEWGHPLYSQNCPATMYGIAQCIRSDGHFGSHATYSLTGSNIVNFS